MNQPSIRRNFLKQSVMASAGMLLVNKSIRANTNPPDAFSGATEKAKNVNETIKSIQSLHTTHGNFSSKEISNDEIELIKQSAICAANSSNMQTYSIVVVRDRELMKKLCGYQGSCLMIFCADYTRLVASAESLGLSYYPDNITSFLTASINTSIAAQTATIAARSLGIDSLLTNGIHRGDMERLWQLLHLPEKYCMPLIALVLGYADKEPDHKVGRLTGKGIFHETTYQPLTKDDLTEITQKYDDPSQHLGLNEDWKKAGHDHYLEWLFKEWLNRDLKPTASESQLFIQLKKRGFVDLQGK